MSNKVPSHGCLCCGKVLDAAVAAFGSHIPKPGDFSICLYCCYPMQFNATLGLEPLDLSKLSVEELAEVVAVQARNTRNTRNQTLTTHH